MKIELKKRDNEIKSVIIWVGLTKFEIEQNINSLIINKFNSECSQITIQPKVANEIIIS